MGVYRVSEDELNRAIGTLNHIHNKLERCYDDLNRTYRSLQNQSGLGIQNVKYTINAQKETLRIQKHNVEQIRDCVQSIINKTKEASVNAQKMLESVDLSKAMVDAATVATGVAGAVTGAGGGKNNAAPANPTGVGNNGTGWSSYEEINRRAQDLRAQALAKDGRISFNGMCGAFTFRQLLYQGILSPGEQTLLGKDYYGHLTNMGQTKTGYVCEGYAGANGLNDLLNNHSNEILTNVVVSFDQRNPDYPSEAGHVLLIQRIQEGYVYFMESQTVTKFGQTYQEGQLIVMTTEQFNQSYPAANGVVYLHS